MLWHIASKELEIGTNAHRLPKGESPTKPLDAGLPVQLLCGAHLFDRHVNSEWAVGHECSSCSAAEGQAQTEAGVVTPADCCRGCQTALE